nr:major capsid protein [Microviridae sp.]
MFGIKNVLVGASRKRNKLDMSCDVNTTFDFGFLQPTYYSLLSGKDTISLELKQLVRLAPMVTPTFARMAVVNRGVFVPFSDVFPAFDALMSHNSVTTSATKYIPNQLTFISMRLVVLYYLMTQSLMCAFKIKSTNAYGDELERVVIDPIASTQSGLTFLMNKFNKTYGCFGTLKSGYPWDSGKIYAVDNEMSLDACDFVFRDADDSLVFGFKLNTAAKRARSIFVGLGYSFEYNNNNNISFLPILAFYKAWFDLYAPKRESVWSDTNAYQLINYVYEHGQSDCNQIAGVSPSESLVGKTLKDLMDCYVTAPDDYVSIHSQNPYNDVSLDASIDGFSVPTLYNGNAGDVTGSTTLGSMYKTIRQSSSGQPLYIEGQTDVKPVTGPATGFGISQLSLDVLRVMSKYVNKDSVIGKRIADYMRIHFDSEVDSQFFDASKPVFELRTDCSIDDVFCTTQNYENPGKGEDLGAYAGRGIGSANGKFSFKADSFGMFMVVSAVVPRSGYYQGDAPYLYGLTRFTLPNPDYDALGFEVTPLACIYDNRGLVSHGFTDGSVDFSGKGFGYIPRYSGFKCHKNIVSGDMSLRSTYDSFGPYFLDKVITPCGLETQKDNQGISRVQWDSYGVPRIASTEWRYLNKYDYIGDYNRIFYNRGHFGFTYEGKASLVRNDNFIVQMAFNVTQTSLLKPIQRSYDTFIENINDTFKSVNAE